MAKKDAGKTKHVLLAIAIAIVFTAFVFIGIQTFYPSPEYSDFCKDRPFDKSTNQESCEASNGTWIAYDYEVNQLNCQVTSEINNSLVLQCDRGLLDNGNCEYDRSCGEGYSEAEEAHSRIGSIIMLVLGILAIIVSVALKLASVSSGLMGGGILTIMFGLFWIMGFATDVLRFVILAVVLIILIFLGYKKLK